MCPPSSLSSSNSEHIVDTGKRISIFYFNRKDFVYTILLVKCINLAGRPWPERGGGWVESFSPAEGKGEQDRLCLVCRAMWQVNTHTGLLVFHLFPWSGSSLLRSLCASSCASDVFFFFLCNVSQGFIFIPSVSLVFLQMCSTAHALLIVSLSGLKLLPFSLS